MRGLINLISHRILLTAFCLSLAFNFACTPRSFEKPNVAVVNTNENAKSAFESDLETMKTAGFEYIFVFRRQDGAPFNSEDRKFLRTISPPEINRFVSTDDGKAFIAGSKFVFPADRLKALRLRFNIEDYSTTKEANK